MVLLSASKFQQKDINNQLTQEINQLTAKAFLHEIISPTVETAVAESGYISYLQMNNEVVASGFGKEDTYNPYSKYKTMYIHTFATKFEYRGKGLCKKIINEFIKKFGKTHILYLTVRTEKNNYNDPAIKCYTDSGFIMLPDVYRNHYDGKNNAMVRVPTPIKKASFKKKKRSKKRK
tara:strand:- start:450 stop:980 length:531 start_codon:yes stop_codon:yes gene_type:complete